MDTHAENADPTTVDWAAFRRQMPITRRYAYFDHAAVSPLPEPARAAVAQWAEEAAVDGDSAWPNWARQAEELRRRLAELLGASSEEIALARNTTEGINFVAEGFPWHSGDNVVTLSDEFPSNQYAWLNLAKRGVAARRIDPCGGRLDLNQVADGCDERTRIVSISWVGYSSGWRNDLDRLAELVHDRGALLMVDAIQGLGVMPLDVRRTPIDFLAADGHKWLLGPEGAGVFFIRREHLDLLRPLGLGWHSVVHEHDFTRIELTPKPSAARYEGGSQNMIGAIALKASLELLTQFGPAALSRRIFEVTDLACRRLEQIGARIRSDRSAEHKSGIVTFDLPGRDPRELRARCLEKDVVLSCRGGGLRISPHAYNDSSDIDRLIDALT